MGAMMFGGGGTRIWIMVVALLFGGAIEARAQAIVNEDSRHAGYYYPPLTSTEIYKARGAVLPQATRETRLAFVTGLTQQQLTRPYPPNFAIFAKGDDAEKMIIVSMGDQGFRGIFQGRALLAQLTAVSRTSQLLRDFAVEDLFTFLDLARLLGFSQLTLSDGETFAHQIELK
jgi:hypothetical protein